MHKIVTQAAKTKATLNNKDHLHTIPATNSIVWKPTNQNSILMPQQIWNILQLQKRKSEK